MLPERRMKRSRAEVPERRMEGSRAEAPERRMYGEVWREYMEIQLTSNGNAIMAVEQEQAVQKKEQELQKREIDELKLLSAKQSKEIEELWNAFF